MATINWGSLFLIYRRWLLFYSAGGSSPLRMFLWVASSREFGTRGSPVNQPWGSYLPLIWKQSNIFGRFCIWSFITFICFMFFNIKADLHPLSHLFSSAPLLPYADEIGLFHFLCTFFLWKLFWPAPCACHLPRRMTYILLTVPPGIRTLHIPGGISVTCHKLSH